MSTGWGLRHFTVGNKLEHLLADRAEGGKSGLWGSSPKSFTNSFGNSGQFTSPCCALVSPFICKMETIILMRITLTKRYYIMSI